jgi:hypothetical protein
VDGGGEESYLVADFGISGVESWGSTAIVFVGGLILFGLRDVHYPKRGFPPSIIYVLRGPYYPSAVCRNLDLNTPEILGGAYRQ